MSGQPTWLVIVLAVIAMAGGGGGLYGALTVGSARRKMTAESDGITAATIALLGKSAVEMLDPLLARVHELEAEVDSLHTKVRALRAELSEREHTIAEMDRTIRQLRQRRGA